MHVFGWRPKVRVDRADLMLLRWQLDQISDAIIDLTDLLTGVKDREDVSIALEAQERRARVAAETLDERIIRGRTLET